MDLTEQTKKALENGYMTAIAKIFNVLIEGMALNDDAAALSSFRRGIGLANRAYHEAMAAAGLKQD